MREVVSTGSEQGLYKQGGEKYLWMGAEKEAVR